MTRYLPLLLMLGCQTTGGGGQVLRCPGAESRASVGPSDCNTGCSGGRVLVPDEWVMLFISRDQGLDSMLTGIGLIVLNVLLAGIFWTLVLIIGTVGVATLVFGINLKDLKLCRIVPDVLASLLVVSGAFIAGMWLGDQCRLAQSQNPEGT